MPKAIPLYRVFVDGGLSEKCIRYFISRSSEVEEGMDGQKYYVYDKSCISEKVRVYFTKTEDAQIHITCSSQAVFEHKVYMALLFEYMMFEIYIYRNGKKPYFICMEAKNTSDQYVDDLFSINSIGGMTNFMFIPPDFQIRSKPLKTVLYPFDKSLAEMKKDTIERVTKESRYIWIRQDLAEIIPDAFIERSMHPLQYKLLREYFERKSGLTNVLTLDCSDCDGLEDCYIDVKGGYLSVLTDGYGIRNLRKGDEFLQRGFIKNYPGAEKYINILNTLV